MITEQLSEVRETNGKRVAQLQGIPSPDAKKDCEIIQALSEALKRIPGQEAKKEFEIVPALSDTLKRIPTQQSKKEREVIQTLSDSLKRILSPEAKKDGEIVPIAQRARIPSPEAKKDGEIVRNARLFWFPGEIVRIAQRARKAKKQGYEIVEARSDAEKDEVYRIRHKVYCEELAFEPRRPDGREHDEYDDHSRHLLVRCLQPGEFKGKFIGCARLVRTRPLDPHYPLPFEKACKDTLDRSIVDPANLPRATIGELSRLAVLDQFRKRKGEEKRERGSSQNSHTPTQLRVPCIVTDLMLEFIKFAREDGIDTLFVLTEVHLAKHLRLLGFNFQQIGARIDHHGQRLPSKMNIGLGAGAATKKRQSRWGRAASSVLQLAVRIDRLAGKLHRWRNRRMEPSNRLSSAA